MLDGHPQKSAPGERFAYCNGGLMVLAILLERATGGTYHDVVRALVIEPAGLERTGFIPLNELPADAALGYLSNEGDLVNTLHLPVLGNGDGGAFTTAEDLHRFWLALLDGRIVSRETVERMTRPRHEVPEENMRHGMGVLDPPDPPGAHPRGVRRRCVVPVHAPGRRANDGERAREQLTRGVAGHRSARPRDRRRARVTCRPRPPAPHVNTRPSFAARPSAPVAVAAT